MAKIMLYDNQSYEEVRNDFNIDCKIFRFFARLYRKKADIMHLFVCSIVFLANPVRRYERCVVPLDITQFYCFQG